MEIYTVGAGHVARFFIGRTKGFYSPALSIEQVRDHLDEIRDDAQYTVPGGPADEMSELFATILGNRPDHGKRLQLSYGETRGLAHHAVHRV